MDPKHTNHQYIAYYQTNRRVLIHSLKLYLNLLVNNSSLFHMYSRKHSFDYMAYNSQHVKSIAEALRQCHHYLL